MSSHSDTLISRLDWNSKNSFSYTFDDKSCGLVCMIITG